MCLRLRFHCTINYSSNVFQIQHGLSEWHDSCSVQMSTVQQLYQKALLSLFVYWQFWNIPRLELLVCTFVLIQVLAPQNSTPIFPYIQFHCRVKFNQCHNENCVDSGPLKWPLLQEIAQGNTLLSPSRKETNICGFLKGETIDLLNHILHSEVSFFSYKQTIKNKANQNQMTERKS